MKGKITRVAPSTGGIQLDGNESVWYNPSDEKVKKYVTKELFGKEVDLTMTDKPNKFSFIKIIGETQSETDFTPADKLGEVEKRRIRSMAIAYAKDLVVADKFEASKLKAVAEKIFEYIWDGYVREE